MIYKAFRFDVFMWLCRDYMQCSALILKLKYIIIIIAIKFRGEKITLTSYIIKSKLALILFIKEYLWNLKTINIG